MLFEKYHFHGVFQDPAVLPVFKGSTFRGVFGVALKKVVCALRQQECGTCLLRAQCLYARVFETLGDSGGGKPSPPHPFVIEPPATVQTHFQPGDAFDFVLLLFGWANEYLPYFVYAFEEMGQLGLGRRLGGQRPRFQLAAVAAGEKILYRQEDRLLLQHTPPVLEPPRLPSAPGPPGTLTVILETPLRLKYRNALRAELPFHVLIRAALRRLAALNEYFGAGEPPWDYRGLVARAQEVQIAAADLSWHDWRRYSNRQDQAMLMGGMVGQVTYTGPVGEFLPLLKYNEQVHVGKATTFGLGKLRLGQCSL